MVDRESVTGTSSDQNSSYDPSRPFPTEEEWATLPRVAGTIPWTAWTVAIVEFMERFSYYGTSAVCTCHPKLAYYTSCCRHHPLLVISPTVSLTY